jgi:hypothetical protein
MKDNLEDFIKNNQLEFDTLEPSGDLWSKLNLNLAIVRNHKISAGYGR